MEKIINFEFPGEPPYDFQKVGYYYKSDNDVSSHYMIEIDVKEETTNVIVKIGTISIPQDDIEIGSKIALCDYEFDFVCEIDLWSKYFFPKFNNERQLYYDDCDKWKANEITSMSDAMNYAIQKGLEIGKIKTY